MIHFDCCRKRCENGFTFWALHYTDCSTGQLLGYQVCTDTEQLHRDPEERTSVAAQIRHGRRLMRNDSWRKWRLKYGI